MKGKYQVTKYVYENVLVDNGEGLSSNGDLLSIDGLRLKGNADYDVKYSNFEGAPIGKAVLFKKDGKLYGNFKTLRPIHGLFCNIGFQVLEREVFKDGKPGTITDSVLHHLMVGGFVSEAPKTPIPKHSDIVVEDMEFEIPDTDAAL